MVAVATRFSRALLLACAALASITVRGADSGSEYQRIWAAREAGNAQLLRSLDALEPTRFYRLDGSMKPEISAMTVTFHGHPVLAAETPSGHGTREQFKSSLRRVLEASNGAQAACFNPRHGVTLSDGKQQFDIVLCFECREFFVYGADGKVIYVSGFDAQQEAAAWDAAFDAAGAALPLPGPAAR